MTDLRYGYVVDEHWAGRCRFEKRRDPRIPVPLPAGVDCFAIAGALNTAFGGVGHDVIGDGLVTV
jgi:hypothetical protein